MSDDITAPITPTPNRTHITSLVDPNMMWESLYKPIMDTRLNRDGRVQKIVFFRDKTDAAAVFYGQNGSEILRIDDLLIGYDGNSPMIAGHILDLFEVPERTFRAAQKAAHCKDGSIEYRVTLEQWYGKKEGVLAFFDRLLRGDGARPHWSVVQ